MDNTLINTTEQSMLNRKSISNLGVLSLTLALGLCCASVATAETYSTHSSPYVTASGAMITDQELVQKIGDKVGPGWITNGYRNITIKSENGNVTLIGSVNTPSDKENVEKSVRNIDGVRSLVSHITILDVKNEFPQDTYATPADDQLNKKIRDHVSKGILWNSYQDVSLNTVNGEVTLGGSVCTLRDQHRLLSEVQKIEGVSGVNSTLIIRHS